MRQPNLYYFEAIKTTPQAARIPHTKFDQACDVTFMASNWNRSGRVMEQALLKTNYWPDTFQPSISENILNRKHSVNEPFM